MWLTLRAQPERYVEVVLLAQRIWDRMLQGKQKFVRPADPPTELGCAEPLLTVCADSQTFDATIKWLQLRPLSDIILRYDFILCDEVRCNARVCPSGSFLHPCRTWQAQDMSECQRFIIESQR